MLGRSAILSGTEFTMEYTIANLRSRAGRSARRHILAAIAGLAATVPTTVPAQSVDSVVARVVAAFGGMGRLHTVRSKRLTGRISFDSVTSATLVVEQRRPDMIREEVTSQGQTVVRAFDGAAAWTQSLTGDTTTHVLSGDDVRNLAAEGDFDGALIDARVKGNRVELMGLDSVGGQRVYKLKVLLRSGYTDYYYVDSATALPIKWQGTRIINGGPIVFESYFRDYLTVDGARFARVIESGSPGSNARQHIVFEHVDINPVLDNSRFAAPPLVPSVPPADSTPTGANR
jgi:hypothetical protein